jgi:hypothetical protein
VYDVKPYLPWCEAKPEARSDWAKEAPATRAAADVIIPAEIARVLPATVVTLVRQLLGLNLQPAYQAVGNGQTYGMAVAGWNVRWRPHPDGKIEVLEAVQLTR